MSVRLWRAGSKKLNFGCFVAGTSVVYVDGELPIEQITEGHLIRAADLGGPLPGLVVDGDQLVWVLAEHGGPARLDRVVPGSEVLLGSHVFLVMVDDEGRTVAIPTGDVFAPVTDTFSRSAHLVIDAELLHVDGTVDILSGTPNHPFWVPAVQDYVPLGTLEVGTVLHVQGDGEAILVSKTWRQGEFEVFDFEVEGLHNFYVRGEGSDAAGVLVHNSTGKGTATFKKFEGSNLGPTDRHVTVEINDAGGQSLGEFHQTGVRNTSIEGVDGSFGKPTKTHTVDLDDPAGAAEFGSSGFPSGRYRQGSNDCVTGACAVANQGSPSAGSVSPSEVRKALDME